MAASMQLLKTSPFRFHSTSVPQRHHRPSIIRCSITSSTAKSYHTPLLPGHGISPEVISVTKNILNPVGSIEGIEFKFNEMPMGGAALDLTRVPLPEETLTTAKQYDVVLPGAIGGYKWDKNKKHSKSETGLLQLRDGLKVSGSVSRFDNMEPCCSVNDSVATRASLTQYFLYRITQRIYLQSSLFERGLSHGTCLTILD